MRPKLIQALLVIFILFLGGLLAFYLVHTKPKLKRRKPPRHVPLVKVIQVFPRDYQVEITEFGTVRPVRIGEIVPEVSGRIIYISPSLVAGGRFRQGEALVRLDPVDYETAVALAQGELSEAERHLAEVESEAESSIKEWRDILQNKTPPPPLVAREPQLAAARARVEAARAKLRKAKADLARTVIRAPFDGLVVEENVGLGQFVSPGVVLARVYETKAMEVAVPLDERELQWLEVPGFNASKGSVAKIFLGERPAFWTGRIVRAAAKAEEKTRLLPVFVRVEDPLATKPPLLPGLFVRVVFRGKSIPKAYVLPREALHRQGKGFRVFLVNRETRLEVRRVKVAYFSRTQAVLTEGLFPGAKVIVSRLAAPIEGMKVRLEEAKGGPTP